MDWVVLQLLGFERFMLRMMLLLKLQLTVTMWLYFFVATNKPRDAIGRQRENLIFHFK
jgi:hypothetical protein